MTCLLDREKAFGDVALRRSANGSAENERVAQGNSSQFNSLDLFLVVRDQQVEGFESFRPDHFLQLVSTFIAACASSVTEG